MREKQPNRPGYPDSDYIRLVREQSLADSKIDIGEHAEHAEVRKVSRGTMGAAVNKKSNFPTNR